MATTKKAAAKRSQSAGTSSETPEQPAPHDRLGMKRGSIYLEKEVHARVNKRAKERNLTPAQYYEEGINLLLLLDPHPPRIHRVTLYQGKPVILFGSGAIQISQTIDPVDTNIILKLNNWTLQRAEVLTLTQLLILFLKRGQLPGTAELEALRTAANTTTETA